MGSRAGGIGIGMARLPRPGAAVALFLPDALSDLDSACAAAGRHAAAFDTTVCELPGHGGSAPAADASLAGLADAFAAFIDAHMPAAFALIGEGLGALIALELAHLRPERVDDVTVIDMPVVLTRPGLAHRLTRRWQADPSVHRRRLLRDIYGIDPLDGATGPDTPMWDLVEGLEMPCTVLANDPVVATDDDLSELYETNERLLIRATVEDRAYQPMLPGTPLNGPATWDVIHPP